MTTLILLPGLNGTNTLFQGFIAAAPEDAKCIAIEYPKQACKTYSELIDQVEKAVEDIEGDFIILGESFSGPIAVEIAAKKPAGLKAVILAASFVQPPNFNFTKYLPWKLGFKLATPIYTVREKLARPKNRPFIRAILNDLRQVPAEVMAYRISEIFNMNATKALEQCDVPLLYLQGKYDFVVPKKNFRVIQRLAPNVRRSVLPTQHFLLQSHPKKAWETIIKFLEEQHQWKLSR